MKLAHDTQEANRSPPQTTLIMDVRKKTVLILLDREVKPYELRVSRNDLLGGKKSCIQYERINVQSRTEIRYR